MGTPQSDLGEQEAGKVVGPIPVVSFFYGGIRAAVYAPKNDIAEAQSGALGMIPFVHNIIHGVFPAVVGSVTASLRTPFIIPEHEVPLICVLPKVMLVGCASSR